MIKATGKKSIKPPHNIEKYDIHEHGHKIPLCEAGSHHWRNTTLRNSVRAYKIILCFNCDRLMYDINGNVQQELLDQGFIYGEYKTQN